MFRLDQNSCTVFRSDYIAVNFSLFVYDKHTCAFTTFRIEYDQKLRLEEKKKRLEVSTSVVRLTLTCFIFKIEFEFDLPLQFIITKFKEQRLFCTIFDAFSISFMSVNRISFY